MRQLRSMVWSSSQDGRQIHFQHDGTSETRFLYVTEYCSYQKEASKMRRFLCDTEKVQRVAGGLHLLACEFVGLSELRRQVSVSQRSFRPLATSVSMCPRSLALHEQGVASHSIAYTDYDTGRPFCAAVNQSEPEPDRETETETESRGQGRGERRDNQWQCSL